MPNNEVSFLDSTLRKIYPQDNEWRERAKERLGQLTMPFWALGFAKIEGMPFERWLPLMWRHWTAGNRMTYANRGRFVMAGLADARRTNVTKVYRRLSRRRGIELWEPGERDE